MTPSAPTDSHDQATTHSYLSALRATLGEAAVLTGSDISETYTRDWTRDRHGQCLAVVKPTTSAEVSQVCALSHATGIGIIPQGGHTGLVGGAQRNRGDCILISTQRMTAIEEIDADGMTCTVQAGAVLETVQTTLGEQGFQFGVAIGSQGSAQIGGLISTNAGGVNVLRHGMMGSQVLGLEMVLPQGQILSSITGLHKDNRGPDPLRLAIGAEGVFGVVTRACLRILPRQTHSATAYAGCASMQGALDLLRHIRSNGHEVLSAFEVMSQSCMPLAQSVDPSMILPVDAPVHVLIAFSSAMDLPLQDHLETLLASAFEQGMVQDAVIAQSRSQAARFWSIREGLVEGQIKRGYHVRSDVSVRLGRVPQAAVALETMLAEEFPGWIPQTYGHLGDGNLHFNALPPESKSEEEARAVGKTIEARIFDIVTELGGSFSAEHGIGRTKAGWFRKTLPARHDLLAQLKFTLDPKGIMNPGCLLAENPTHPPDREDPKTTGTGSPATR